MQILPHTVIAGVVVIGILAGVIGGGAFWIATGLAVVIGAGYWILNRRLKREQGRGERLSSELHPDR